MVPKTLKVKRESSLAFAAASCECNESRQNGLITVITPPRVLTGDIPS